VRYKVRLVAQGFTQRPDIDFNKIYSLVMNRITFQYLISLATQKRLSLQLMDVVTVYLYESQDSDIYMKVPERISIPNKNVGRNIYCVKLNNLLYGLKQSGRMWYNRLKQLLLNAKATLITMIVLVSSYLNLKLDFALFQCLLMI
jgi:hypothetical protein